MEATTISTVLIKQRSKQQFHQLPRGTAKWCLYQVQSRFVVGPAKDYKSQQKAGFPRNLFKTSSYTSWSYNDF